MKEEGEVGGGGRGDRDHQWETEAEAERKGGKRVKHKAVICLSV